ncbi:hypothetical protein Tco_0982326, partial [Tanacetum coccineum]
MEIPMTRGTITNTQELVPHMDTPPDTSILGTTIPKMFTIRVCIKSAHQMLIFASTSISVNKVTYSYRVRELCSWTPSFVSDDVGSMKKGNFVGSDKVEDDEKESVGDFYNNEDG